MRVISKARLKSFWAMHDDAEGPLRAWYTHVNQRSVNWEFWGDVKAAFATASLVGSCVVFNIGGNKYRLVARILYPSHKVLVLRIMTHREYDRDAWKTGCGCHVPDPNKASKRKRRGR